MTKRITDLEERLKAAFKRAERCDHVCSGNCRRVGCHCECGEFHDHEVVGRAFSHEQLAIIAAKEKECADAGCEGIEHKCV